MRKFIVVLLLLAFISMGLALLWPRFFDTPRPQPLAVLNQLLRNTAPGQTAVHVLGVQNEATVEKLTPQVVVQHIVDQAKDRVTDVVVTHLSRLIVDKFSALPQDQQQQILEALTEALNPSPTQNLSNPTQQSTNTNNNP